MVPDDPALAGVPSGGRVTSRLIVGLTAWWLAFPIAFWAGSALFDGDVYVDSFWDWVGRILLILAIGGALLSPIAGIVVSLAGRRRGACVQFAMMAALSFGVFFYFLYALLTVD
ncbi:hypothetical protein [Actinomadura sp. NPDC048394]|uniref:hypothetical protein n=1 Tax=Actinomadura sp. NPDC048394 TaxID=3158223 RepID=UPI0033F345AB